MFSVWGLVNILIHSVGFGSMAQPRIPPFNGGSDDGGSSFFQEPSRSGGTGGGSGTLFGDSCQTDRDCDDPYVCINSACVDVL
jgi:hypothetical protein